MQHRDRQRQALTQPERQGTGRLIGDAEQVEALNQCVDALRAFGLGQVEQTGVQLKVLPHAEFAIQRKALGHEADPLARGQILGVHRIAQQCRAAFAGRHQPGQDFHGRGLAAAVGAEKTENLAATDGEADVIHRSEVAEAQRQVVGFDGNVGGTASTRRNDQRLSVVMTVALEVCEGFIEFAAGGDGR
ncbi:hypothetical protein D3C72_838310 [compost metagenome]